MTMSLKMTFANRFFALFGSVILAVACLPDVSPASDISLPAPQLRRAATPLARSGVNLQPKVQINRFNGLPTFSKGSSFAESPRLPRRIECDISTMKQTLIDAVRPVIETLESRVLLSSVALQDGALQIIGDTSTPNHISVTPVARHHAFRVV